MRLFVRAGLEGHSLPGRHGARLTTRIFEPVIAALREEAGLPHFSECGMMSGERELAMTLHGAVVFLGIRQHIYQMTMPPTIDDVIRLQVETFASGARHSIKQIGSGSLRVRMGQVVKIPGVAVYLKKKNLI